MKHQDKRNEGREWYELDPQYGEKNVCLKMCRELDKQSSDGECFLAEIVSQCHRSLGIILYALSAELVLKNKSNFRKRFYEN